MEKSPKQIHYVTGGARSGKSTYALRLAKNHRRRAFVATAEPFDDEMKRRIELHRKERADEGFHTVEAPIDLAEGVRAAAAHGDVVLLDCLTVWLGNLFHKEDDPQLRRRRIEQLEGVVREVQSDVILVSNELGMGVVPATPLGRAFRDEAGRLNQRFAALADRAVLMVSGLPLVLGQAHSNVASTDQKG